MAAAAQPLPGWRFWCCRWGPCDRASHLLRVDGGPGTRIQVLTTIAVLRLRFFAIRVLKSQYGGRVFCEQDGINGALVYGLLVQNRLLADVLAWQVSGDHSLVRGTAALIFRPRISKGIRVEPFC